MYEIIFTVIASTILRKHEMSFSRWWYATWESCPTSGKKEILEEVMKEAAAEALGVFYNPTGRPERPYQYSTCPQFNVFVSKVKTTIPSEVAYVQP
jgi:hypothetical protein